GQRFNAYNFSTGQRAFSGPPSSPDHMVSLPFELQNPGFRQSGARSIVDVEDPGLRIHLR
ncbi:hypothetical protein U1Q18_037415, partial [Sarracenia purpurea var. burkii]